MAPKPMKAMTAMKAMKTSKPMKAKTAAMKTSKPMKAMKAMKAMKSSKPMKAMKAMKAMKSSKPMKAMKAMKAMKTQRRQPVEANTAMKVMKDVSTQIWDGPVDRPDWAMHGLTSTDPGTNEELFEVHTLEEGRWVCSTGMRKDTRLEQVVQECESPGCGSFNYRGLAIAVSVERAERIAGAESEAE